MRKKTILLILLFAISTILISQNYSKRSSLKERFFNPQSITTLKGKIIGIDSVKMRTNSIIRLNIETKKGPIFIHTAPYWYLNKNNVLFKVGEKIKVRGSKINYKGNPTIIAVNFSYKSKQIKLRDANGLPLWAKKMNGKGKKGRRGNGRKRKN